nr:dipeptide epimerase [Gemmatimonadota bacterium]
MPLHVEWEVLDLATRHAFHIARQAAPPARRNVWVRVRAADGLEGWGEAPATPFYGETAETVLAVLPRLVPHLEEPWALERTERTLAGEIGRNPAARAALSAALHDLLGKRLGQPVWKLWGLEPRAPVSSFTLGIDTPEVMRAKLREAGSYPVLKIKVGSARDEEILRLIRDVAPDKTIRVDANTGWTASQAIRALPMLEAFGVELVEQPVAKGDLQGMARVRRASRIPVIADESCEVAADVPRLAEAVDGVNIKLAKCGSLREAVRIVHTARAHGLQVMLG